MGKTLAVFTCFLSACIFVDGCSRATPIPTPPQPAPGVLAIDAADNPTPQRSAKSYRIGKSTIPAGDFEALKRAITAARKDMPQQDPNRPRLIVQANANVDAKAIAPVVLTAIRAGFEPVDLDGNLPVPVPRMEIPDQPPHDPICVRVLTSPVGTVSYEMTAVGAIDSERKLSELLKQFNDFVTREGSRPGTPIIVEPRGQTKDDYTLTAYSQAIRAGFIRFVSPPGPTTLYWSPPSNPPTRMKLRDVPTAYPPPSRPRPLESKLFDVPIACPPPSTPGPPKSKLFDVSTEAHHIVYICDRSGSLAPVFQEVQHELVKSIAHLRTDQDFAILMMAHDRPLELHSDGLLSGEMQNKLKAVKFLKQVTPTGTTTLLPSLKRAFGLLGTADKTKPGKVIFILTDGDFAGIAGSYTAEDGRKLAGNDAVIHYLRDHNADKAVQVNTILLYNKEDDAVKVHKQIAAENGGQFRLVTEDE